MIQRDYCGDVWVFSYCSRSSVLPVERLRCLAEGRESAALDQESQAALATLAAQQTTLKQNIDQLQTPRGKEAALRQAYSVGAQGENMIVIVGSSSTPPPPPPTFLDKLKSAFSWW